jgi:diguanylate cyclase (GGDEF)-like protein
VAVGLSACIREGDTVARLGGDEFVVMLEDLSVSPQDAHGQAEKVAHKILQTLNQSYQLGEAQRTVTPSIGVALFGDVLENVDEPLKRADIAMYKAKGAGRNTVRFFEPQT